MTRRMRSVAGFAAGLAAVVVAESLAWAAPNDAREKPGPVPPSVLQSSEETATPAQAAAPVGQDPIEPAATAAEVPPAPLLDGLKISSQSWRRGGLGSKALITFTVRNANDYAVRDIEIVCAFARRDGSHLTYRKHVIRNSVKKKSRKTFRRVHVGFVNVNAAKAKCALVAASRI
ncbi:MAG: hypothetical protein AB7I42_23650 [Bradyrhizobium sp.]|uniref:hypothetical protein n=1 Tax=Bradyrhizobium sp. TaxID=376 RepID=UPI003D11D94A